MRNVYHYDALHSLYKDDRISGRYITNNILELFLNSVNGSCKKSILGYSVFEKPIYLIEIGSGEMKVLIWSQMHGNESTTTKAIFDFINFISSDDFLAVSFRKEFSFIIIPILNPDGAELYTRENSNKVDLNRDFVALTQPESKVLMDLFINSKPDFCFNMHDQRTIFSAETGKPATISFLAPSFNQSCDINENRQLAINIIADINKVLQPMISGQVGRFDDGYNSNCVGDTFQTLGVPTILFEAGHYPNDYQREVSRKIVFISLIAACESARDKTYLVNRTSDYLNIPQNKTLFYDFVYKNVKINYDGNEILSIFAAQYKEVLREGSVALIPYISEVNVDDNVRGHVEYDGESELFRDNFGNYPVKDRLANFRIGDKRFLNGVFISKTTKV